MKNIKLFLSAITLTTLVSCVNGDDYGTPDLTGECTTKSVTLDPSDVTSVATTTVAQWTVNDTIEAYVTSSDEGGNFYKSISMVSVDGTVGFSIPVDQYNLYNKFEPGRKVFVSMKDRWYQIDNSSTVIGDLYQNTDVGRIPAFNVDNVIFRGCDKVDEDDIINHLTIPQVKQNSNINKLIEIDGIQFTDGSLDGKYYDSNYPNFNFSNPVYPSNIGGGTNHQIVDANGNTLVVRVSEYANFAGDITPSGNGKIRGVLTKFGSTWQFMIRTLNDVQMDQPRIDFFPPLVGSSLAYNGSINEPFTSYSTNQQNFPLYINDAATSNRYWQVKLFSGNRYIQMTSFGGSGEYKSLFIVPVDMTAANTFSFKTKDGYDNGAVLKVYYSTDYVPGGDVNDATLVDITSNFTISSGNTSGYGANFINSGNYSIPTSVTGNGYFLFEYKGNGTTGPTTTMQIDDIVVN